MVANNSIALSALDFGINEGNKQLDDADNMERENEALPSESPQPVLV